MVEIGGKPLIWHIMKYYSTFGVNDFIICCGYKGYVIKEYFANYFLHTSDVTIDVKTNTIETLSRRGEDWRVTLVDTGEATQTGGRLKRIEGYLDGDFCMTYGDGLGSVAVDKLIAFHRSHGCEATITAVQPPGRFGSILLEENAVRSFQEKPVGDGGWINGGFFVLSRKVLDRISDDSTIWERRPLESLASDDQLRAFFHHGFWQPMDTLRDKNALETHWSEGTAPWKRW
jgi:glucose-1-phosphate cytidylyltransferase